MRGHHDKIDAAVETVKAKGLLRPNMSTTVRDGVVICQLVADGWTGNQLPTRWAIRRYFERVAQQPHQSHQSHVA